jgi:hypothetical protein
MAVLEEVDSGGNEDGRIRKRERRSLEEFQVFNGRRSRDEDPTIAVLFTPPGCHTHVL